MSVFTQIQPQPGQMYRIALLNSICTTKAAATELRNAGSLQPCLRCRHRAATAAAGGGAGLVEER